MNVDCHGRNLLNRSWWINMFDITQVNTPCYVIDEKLLIKNLKILKSVKDESGCKILLATKAFSMYSTFPLIGKYLDGVTSSSLFEAKLGREEMNKEVHIFSPAYSPEDAADIFALCDHVIFNSFTQWKKYQHRAREKAVSCGLRINPEYSEIETDLYNPCAANSRLGIRICDFENEDLAGIDGLHFHTMCEQNSDVLLRTIKFIDKKFGFILKQMKWLNFGGGHHITRSDYDLETLKEAILRMKNKYDLEIYLEPGEAIPLDAGFLVTKVLDIVHNQMDIAILDTSAACHMPDVIEMPYRPPLMNSGLAHEKKYTYRFGGPTCLAGDIIGDYSFEQPLHIGDRLVFEDMAIYTMVKNNTFNGVNLPSIYLVKENNDIQLIRAFGYDDFKSRL